MPSVSEPNEPGWGCQNGRGSGPRAGNLGSFGPVELLEPRRAHSSIHFASPKLHSSSKTARSSETSPTMKVIPSVMALGAFVTALVYSPQIARAQDVVEAEPGYGPVSHVLPAQPELDDLGQHDLGPRRVQRPGHLGGLPGRASPVRGQVGQPRRVLGFFDGERR
ncbi:unnamed protein product [Phytophthora fragariaefolia]|uniref:Unnamed protein product n=1 Tax=Phytophthora fragariaefolia TaxID=1490495 RepID=A0A9W6YM39_9STRA|nr:unnamed protein product [Phytophthora fragariaefolia]